MKIKLLLCFSLFLFAGNCFGQTTFQKITSYGVGGLGYSVQQTSDGGYVVAGFVDGDTSGYQYVYVVKTGADGNILWTKTYGGYAAPNGYCIRQTKDDGFIITGFIFDSSSYQKVLLIKTNSTGDTLWTKQYGGAFSDIGNYVRQTYDGGYIVAGSTQSFGGANGDAYLIKTNAGGDTSWTKTFGGDSIDVAYCVSQTSDSGYIISGQTGSSGAGNDDAYLIRTNANGDTLWTKTYGGPGFDYAYYVEQTSDKGFIFTGSTDSYGDSTIDIYLVKTNAEGDTMWTKTYGGPGTEEAYEVHQTSDGGYILIGYTDSVGAAAPNLYLIKTNSTGDTLWTKVYAGNNGVFGNSVRQTSDGGYIIAGATNSFDIAQTSGAVSLIKTDENGNSGCYLSYATTIVGSTTTTVSPALTFISSGGTTSATGMYVGSGGNDSLICLSTGIQEQDVNNSISIYPNPAGDELRIKNVELRIKAVEIYNVLGEEVLDNQYSINDDQYSINVSFLSPGIYFIQIIGEKENRSGKFIKE